MVVRLSPNNVVDPCVSIMHEAHGKLASQESLAFSILNYYLSPFHTLTFDDVQYDIDYRLVR